MISSSRALFVFVTLSFLSYTTSVNGDCGGIVTIPKNGSVSIEVEVKNQVSAWVSCIWTLVPEANSTISGIKVNVDKLSYQSTQDALELLSWDGESQLENRTLQTSDVGSSLIFNTSHAFLYYSGAHDNKSYVKIVSISGVPSGSSDGRKHQVLHYAQENYVAPEFLTMNYPPFPALAYESLLSLSVVFQSRFASGPALLIEYLDTEADKDYLLEYDLPYDHAQSAVLLGNYSGSHINGFKPTATYAPRLFLFSSNSGSTVGRGFQIRWSYNITSNDI